MNVMTRHDELVRIRDLVKVYNGKRVLDGVDFQVRAGEIFGFLGSNGAGKTTTLEIMEGLRPATSGQVRIFGLDVASNRAEISQRIGVSLQETQYWGLLTVKETIELFRNFYRRRLPLDALLDMFDLRRFLDVQLRTLSGGTYQRVVLALALVNDPELILLDEPTTGLDPQARRNLWDVIRDLRDRGRTIILTTHYMDEASALCDRIAIISQGRITRTGTPQELVRSLGADTAICFSCETAVDLAAISSQGWCGDARAVGQGRYIAYCTNLRVGINGLIEWAERSGLDIHDVETRGASLDDVFMQYAAKVETVA
jgi:ABC-2 type transport system ATP-binding protein